MEIYCTEQRAQRFILVAVEDESFQISAERSLDELADLLKTAGGEEAGRVIQKREAPHIRTYLGSGKIEELRAMVELEHADGIITDDELTPAQLKNLTDEVGTKVIDRTLLILDIFSKRAQTKEGQLQVELAQLNYRLTRLTGLGTELSRLGGSVGGAMHSRGAGETKLEMDRRYIRERISVLKGEIRNVRQNRETARALRSKQKIPMVALVGYTNAGKSTLFNRFTNASVLEEDKLFATLDTTVRKCDLPSGRTVLMCDTVGFIHKLPHQLVQAFRATLEEVCFADILLHVVDQSDEKAVMERDVTVQELEALGAGDKETILILNKKDLVNLNEENLLTFPSQQHMIRVSAFNEEDRQIVLEQIDAILNAQEQEYSVLIPYQQGRLVSLLNENAVILEEEYREEGTYLHVRSREQYKNMVSHYII